ncbi:hypothetical protein BLL42_09340 [Pseudomonas frederiksbergensis]|uniref:Uncharacterized protein n=1 Tax=Pseudomonas frederiksbergensis TaxID=104087 RepID=A0A1J0EJ72_9PSED|nr:hypothetical protein [Pseudomonas frederiksbergensis]APC15928.1 hypothetical protein BLL42_09340 [Pseudomonas frederiksbergensis]
MSIFQRMVLLIKVLVLLSVGTSAAWASNGAVQDQGFWAAKSAQGSGLMVATDDQGKGDSKGDEDPSSDDSEDDTQG